MMSNHDLLQWPPDTDLRTVLDAGIFISSGVVRGTTMPAKFSEDVRTRLEKFDALVNSGSEPRRRSRDLPDLKVSLAFASLYVLKRVDDALNKQKQAGSEEPLLGTKDLAQLRSHLALLLDVGVGELLQRILPTIPQRPSKAQIPPGAQVIDLTVAHENLTQMSELLVSLLRMCRDPVNTNEKASGISTNVVVQMLVTRKLAPFLKACICMGWRPKELRSDLEMDEIMKGTIWLLSVLPPSQCIIALAPLAARNNTIPLYACRVATRMLTVQIGRPAGIAGLLSSMFGEDRMSSEAPLQKLDVISNLLTTIPANSTPHAFFKVVIPRLLYLISPRMDDRTPLAHKRAVAFVLSRILMLDTTNEGKNVLQQCLFPSFHPDTHPSTPEQPERPEYKPSETDSVFASTKATASEAIHALSVIVANADPTPVVIENLLQPLASKLYLLLEYLHRSKTADPTLRETVEGLLNTWGRLSEAEKVVSGLWEVMEDLPFEWGVDEEGEIAMIARENKAPSLSLAQLADLQEGKLDSTTSDDSNPLELRPNPVTFTNFVKNINREDVSTMLYERVFDANTNDGPGADPLKKLTLLQLLMQLSRHGGGHSNDLAAGIKVPDLVRKLSFIKLSLHYADSSKILAEKERGFSLESLRINSDDDEEDKDGDSDDEDLAPGLEGINASEHMSVTAVNLLLALLEEHPNLSPRSVPLLNEIYAQLEPLAQNGSDALRPRAREARVTLTARLASEYPFQPSQKAKDDSVENPQRKYQRALKLLQDPLLPVRAHGLLLLRELVQPAKTISKSTDPKDPTGSKVTTIQNAPIASPSLPAALIPAILSIFMSSLEDEDSYIFLHAVQGLSAMVDGYGTEVLKRLVGSYAGDTAKCVGEMEGREVDRRVRLGEALDQVVRRCGTALGKYIDLIVPHVFQMVRTSYLPTTLRTSAVSVLAATAGTHLFALNAYAADLVGAMVDLIQVESAAAIRAEAEGKKKRKAETETGTEADGEQRAELLPSGKDGLERGRRKQNGKTGVTSPAQSNDIIGGRDKDADGASGDRKGLGLGNGNGSGVSRTGAVAEIECLEEETETMDTHPTKADSKFPPLRRAAIYFLSLLLRAQIQTSYDGVTRGNVLKLDRELLRRAGTVLRYVETVDCDSMVRAMAREAAELVSRRHSGFEL